MSPCKKCCATQRGYVSGYEVSNLLPDNPKTPYEIIESIEQSEGLKQALDCLSERQRCVISMRFRLHSGIKQTLREIAVSLGLSIESVRQHEFMGLHRLRGILKEDNQK